MSKPQYQEASEIDYAPAPKPGEQLRKARESKGFSVEDVVAQIRLERKLLEAVENDDYAKLPAPGYVRGYIRTYARFLGLDPDPLVDAFNREADEGPALQPYASTPAHQAHSGDRLVRAVTWAIGIGLALLVVVWWRSQYMHKPAPASSIASGPATPQPAAPPPPDIVKQAGASKTYPIARPPAEPAPSASGAAPSTAAAVTSAASSAPPANASTIAPPAAATVGAPGGGETGATAPGATAAAQPGAAAEQNQAAQTGQAGAGAPSAAQSTSAPAAQQAGAPAAGNAEHQLVLKLSKESWIEITDSSGKRLYYNLGRAGQTISVSGDPPLHVLIGYVPGVDISYNGKSLDVSALARHGVARFQIEKDGSVK